MIHLLQHSFYSNLDAPEEAVYGSPWLAIEGPKGEAIAGLASHEKRWMFDIFNKTILIFRFTVRELG